MRARLPIRWRLTVWYALLLAIALSLFGVGLYATLRTRLHQNFDEQLHNQAAITLATVTIIDGKPNLDPSDSGDQEGEFFIRLFSVEGRVITATENSDNDRSLDTSLVDSALSGETAKSTWSLDEGNTLRVVTMPVRNEDTIVGVLQVGLSRDEIDETLAELVGVLAVAGPLVLLIAAAGGFFLAGRALKPVVTITEMAARVSERGLHARIDLDLPNDELGRLALTFNAMLARIETAFDRQRRFTGDAAHELRTPLTLMRSQVDLALARSRTPAAYREALQGLDVDLERVTHLVSTLLTLARADTGQLRTTRDRFDLATTVGLVLEQYAPVAKAAGVTLREASSPCIVSADNDMVVQVLVNLIDNALTHTPAGGHITVGCRAQDETANLSVEDTGAGIASDQQDRVFDRFYRVDTGRDRASGGTGLGLAICKTIAEAHGGTIELTSTIGSGTRVELAIPRSVVLSERSH
jgi:heavy metal sensor kinase